MSNKPAATRYQPARLALREWMRGSKVSSKKMAADLEFTPLYISMIRNGRRNISDAFKWKFTVQYGTDAAQQVFGDLPDSPQADTTLTK